MLPGFRSVEEPYRLAAISQAGLFLLACLYTLYFAKPVLLPIVLALVINLALAPIVRGLDKTGLPTPVGAASVVLALVAAGTLAAYQLAAPAALWLERAPTALHKLGEAIAELREPVERMSEAAEQAEELTKGTNDKAVEVTIQQPALDEILLNTTWELSLRTVLVLVLLYFLLASGNRFLKKLVHVMPRLHDKRAVVTVARQVEQQVSAYLFWFAINNAILGSAVTLALYYLGMPNAALWGALAALFNFIPYAGAFLTASILTLASLSAFEDVSKAMTIVGTFLGLTSLEGTLMQPMILGRRLELNPVAILISVMLWGWLWGIPGALLAVPMLAVLKIVSDAVEPLAPIGEMLGRN